MSIIRPYILAASAAAVLMLPVSAPAQAACKRLAFSVNDFGKKGPAADAQALLDSYVATWMRDRGIKRYTSGKKTVDCKKYLDFVLFDEHTCRATITVCWAGKAPVAAAKKS